MPSSARRASSGWRSPTRRPPTSRATPTPASPPSRRPTPPRWSFLQLAGLAEEDEVADALDAAGQWLLAQQAEDGSFLDPENGANANTTGLAGWALLELGEDEAAARAADWLRDLQVVESDAETDAKLAGETGAIAYDEASLEQARQLGLTDPLDRSPWVVAGVQAFPLLAAAPAGDEGTD